VTTPTTAAAPSTPVHGPAPGRLRRLLGPVWAHPAKGLAVAVAVTALWAVAAGVWTPRGPLTAAQAVATMAISLVIGVAAGLLMRSRWALATAPVAFTVVFELTRFGTDGPLVDGMHSSLYGLIAFVAGRGFHGLLALAPMVLGAAVGAGVTRRMSPHPHRRSARLPVPYSAGVQVRRGATVLTAVGLLALAGLVLKPATTAGILGADGEPLPGSVAELVEVGVGGRDLRLMIRGNSVEQPVLLFLAGGPGGSELGAMRRHLQALERHFVVVTWDQRGSGRSYPELEPTSTLTLDGAVDDTVEVTRYLRDRFDEDRVYLVGQSWGSLLGVLAVQQSPDLYEAFVGIGQMVSPRETDVAFYRDTLAWARTSGDDALVATLVRSGPPPYDDVLDYEAALSHEKDVYPYDHGRNSEGVGGFSENILVEEYSLIDKVHAFAGFLDTFTVLYPQLQDVDLRSQASVLQVPVYLVEGRHETPARADLAREWFQQLRAPTKQLVVADTSGHRALFEQPNRFVDLMTTISRTR